MALSSAAGLDIVITKTETLGGVRLRMPDPQAVSMVKMKAESSAWTALQRGLNKDVKWFCMKLEVSFPVFETKRRTQGNPGSVV